MSPSPMLLVYCKWIYGLSNHSGLNKVTIYIFVASGFDIYPKKHLTIQSQQ